MNDSLTHMYSIYWTNFIFLSYLFLFIIIYINIYQSYCKNTFNIIWILLIFYFIELVTTFYLNMSIEKLQFLYDSTNIFLINNLNKYHPFLFYLNIFLIIYFLINWEFNINLFQYLFINTHIVLSKQTQILRIIYISTFMLMLGGWWAFQENTWGGWWNWDSSEVLGAFIFFNYIWVFHIFFITSHFFSIRYLYYFQIIFIFGIYCFIQLNFSISSHNFGFFQFFFNKKNFMTEMTIFCIYIQTWIIILIQSNFIKKFNLIKFFILFRNWNLTFLLCSLFIILILIINFSFLPLIDFCWRLFFNIIKNSINWDFFFYKYFSLFFIITSFFYLLNCLNKVIYFCVIELHMFLVNLLIFIKFEFNRVYFIHFGLLMFFFNTTCELNINFICLFKQSPLVWNNGLFLFPNFILNWGVFDTSFLQLTKDQRWIFSSAYLLNLMSLFNVNTNIIEINLFLNLINIIIFNFIEHFFIKLYFYLIISILLLFLFYEPLFKYNNAISATLHVN